MLTIVRYFLFQAALIPCICLRNDPSATEADDWRKQITITLKAITAMSSLNASSPRCYQIISELCSRYLDPQEEKPRVPQNPTARNLIEEQQNANQVRAGHPPWPADQPVGESPETQINNVFSMMWPNVPPLEAADVVMGDEVGWMEFLRSGSTDHWDNGLA